MERTVTKLLKTGYLASTCNISKISSGEEYSHSARSFRIQRFAEWLKMISIFLCLIFNVTNNTCILSHSEEIKHVFHGLRPVRGLILFLGIVSRLAVHVLLGAQ